MPGARIILNSRYFHIARPGEKADGKYCMTKDAAAGLINYIGTREGVDLNVRDNATLNFDPLRLSPEVAARPATQRQLDAIKQLLEAIPEAKNSFEYQDFFYSKTIGNATELISHAAELGLGYAVDYGEATNLIEYIGKRPGVDRVGEHGLFSSSPEIDIKKAQEAVGACKGNIWTHIISLRREDADALGYDHQKPWRDLVMQKIDVIAEESGIPLSDLHWYAGMHNTTHHPHIHLVVFSDNSNPKAGHLTVKGINKIKAAFSEVIFADERHQIYAHKDEVCESINRKVDEILADIESGNVNAQFSKEKLDVLSGKLLHLAGDLQNSHGKMQYGWLMRDLNLKNQINGIMADFAQSPDIQKLYGLYCADHTSLVRMYREDPQDITPIVNNKEFRDIKNKIVKEAIRLSASGMLSGGLRDIEKPDTALNAEPPFVEKETAGIEDEIPPEKELPPADEDFDRLPASEENPPEKVIEKQSFRQMNIEALKAAAEKGSVAAKYQLGRRYFYGAGVERNYITALKWFAAAADDGHILATYECGKIQLYGFGIVKSPALGERLCQLAYDRMMNDVLLKTGFDSEKIGRSEDIPQTDSFHAYLEYLLGHIMLSGECGEKDYDLARFWLTASALSGYAHAEYNIGRNGRAGERVSKRPVLCCKPVRRSGKAG